mmetsp:Transcript_2883/g.8309  ORF Transcript_2883/g.8309 Transcript_2883/m.8309 type:complete len:213 (-) Transcript_2883:1595-2233(-)
MGCGYGILYSAICIWVKYRSNMAVYVGGKWVTIYIDCVPPFKRHTRGVAADAASMSGSLPPPGALDTCDRALVRSARPPGTRRELCARACSDDVAGAAAALPSASLAGAPAAPGRSLAMSAAKGPPWAPSVMRPLSRRKARTRKKTVKAIITATDTPGGAHTPRRSSASSFETTAPGLLAHTSGKAVASVTPSLHSCGGPHRKTMAEPACTA